MWRKVNESDLNAALSQNEIDAFRKSADFEHDPVESQIRQVCAHVRGIIRSGGKCRLAADESSLPESLISPAMDYLRYQILTRMNLNINESRTKAYESAKETFDKVHSGHYIPESDGEEAAEDKVASSPACGKPNPEKRLLD